MIRLRAFSAVCAFLVAASLTLAQSPPRPTEKVQGWTAAPDPSDLKARPRADIKLTIPIKSAIEIADATRPSALLAVCDANPFGPRQWGTLNLQTGSYTPAFADKIAIEGPQLSPDGLFLVGKVARQHGATPSLGIWSFKIGKPLNHIPGQDVFTVPQPVGFAPGDLLITITTKHFDCTLGGWDLKTANSKWQTKLPTAVELKNTAISPGGKYVAVVYDKGLWLYDTSTGHELSNHPLPEPEEKLIFGSKPLALAFSPDGLELAGLFEHGHGKSRLIFWDMATGATLSDKVAEALKDDRWTKRNERKLEYFPGNLLLRYSTQILDRNTAKVIHTLPANHGGREVEFMKNLAPDKVLIVNEKGTDDRAAVTVLSLPKDQIAKAQDVVRAGGKSSDANLPPLTKPDFSAVRVALDTGAPEPYSLKPHAPATRTSVGANPIALRPPRPPSGIAHHLARIIFTGQPANQAAVAYHLGGTLEKDPAKRKTIIDRINLGGGTPAGSLEVPNNIAVPDISSDGKLVLVRQGEDRLDLYSFATTPAKHVLGFRPYEGDKNGDNIAFAAILSPDQLLTVSNAGRLVLWQITGAKAVYELTLSAPDFHAGPGFTLSPNRKHLAFGNGSGVTLLDPATGQPLAHLKGPKATGDHIAFSPDGLRLAHFTFRPHPHLRAYDLATGKLIGDCALPPETWTGPVAWAGPANVLVNGYLADLERKIAVWRYVHGGLSVSMTGTPDSRTWAVVTGQPNQLPTLVPFTIPHDDARKVITSIRAEQNIVLKPGMKISVEAGVEGDPQFQQKVLDTLKSRATEAGLVVAPHPQPIRLVATTTHKGSKTLDYDIIGRGRETVIIPEYQCTLQIIKDSQTIWEASTKAGGYASGFVHLRRDQTAQSLVDQSNKNPGEGFYLNATIPGTVAKPLEKLGTSRFTLKGIVDATPPN